MNQTVHHADTDLIAASFREALQAQRQPGNERFFSEPIVRAENLSAHGINKVMNQVGFEKGPQKPGFDPDDKYIDVRQYATEKQEEWSGEFTLNGNRYNCYGNVYYGTVNVKLSR